MVQNKRQTQGQNNVKQNRLTIWHKVIRKLTQGQTQGSNNKVRHRAKNDTRSPKTSQSQKTKSRSKDSTRVQNVNVKNTKTIIRYMYV